MESILQPYSKFCYLWKLEQTLLWWSRTLKCSITVATVVYICHTGHNFYGLQTSQIASKTVLWILIAWLDHVCHLFLWYALMKRAFAVLIFPNEQTTKFTNIATCEYYALYGTCTCSCLYQSYSFIQCTCTCIQCAHITL